MALDHRLPSSAASDKPMTGGIESIEVPVATSEALLDFDFDTAYVNALREAKRSDFNYVGSEFSDRDPSGGLSSAEVQQALEGLRDKLRAILDRAVAQKDEPPQSVS
jgi:hypothetical protein